MLALLTIALVFLTPAFAQPDSGPRLESLLAEARQAQARSDFGAAAGAYRQALAIRPDLAELWSNFGLMLHQSGEYSQAEKAFRKSLDLNQSLLVPNLFLGLELLQLKRPREAVPYLSAAAKLAPADPQPPLALGRAYHAMWEPARSREWYQRAVALAPGNGEAWFGLGLAYLGSAESAAAQLTRLFLSSPYVSELAGDAFAEQGRLEDAIRRYREMLASGQPLPRCSRSSYGLALLRHDDRSEAGEQFQIDRSTCTAAPVGEARLLFESGDREKALAILAGLARSSPAEFQSALPAFWRGLNPEQLEALLQQLRQSRDEIADVVAGAIRRGPAPVFPLDSPPPELSKLTEDRLLEFAADAFFSGKFRHAALAGERLRQQYPKHAAGWYWTVRAHQKLGVASLARAGEVEPGSPRIHALLGDVYQKRKMYTEAQEEYSKILAIKPDDLAGLAGLAAAYLSDGQLELAQVTAQKALARDPADGDVNLLMGEILVAQHEYAGAEPHLQKGLHVRADLLARVHALLGRVYARTGRPKEAIRELTLGLPSDEDGSVYYQLARVYMETGDDDDAAAALAKSKEILARRDAMAQGILKPVN